MELAPGIRVVEPYPAVHVKALDALVVADLHLGFEAAMAERGVQVPATQLRDEMRTMQRVLKKAKASNVILAGDIKHLFPAASVYEYRDVKDFLSFLAERFSRVIVVRGNHDTYIERNTSVPGVELVDSFQQNGVLVLHGHELPATDDYGVLVMGHEHAVLQLSDDAGTTESVKCFLSATMRNGKHLVVLPPFSPLAHGYPVNRIPDEPFLSPILREMVEVDAISVTGVDEAAGMLPFGGSLKEVLKAHGRG